ncbi:MAG: hypothetical protein H8F28_19590 [Fibrella sp.]|nr:hypothetical protein [Armatimonadota bacterium]
MSQPTSLIPNTIETVTQSRGRTLLAGLRREEKKIASPSDAFYDALMALTTADEKLKVELFRFVDALRGKPVTRLSNSIANFPCIMVGLVRSRQARFRGY